MAHTSRTIRIIAIAMAALTLVFTAPPARAETKIIAPQTFGPAWRWTGTQAPGGTSTPDQRVEVHVSGLVDDDHNGAAILRSGGASFLRVLVRKSTVAVEDDSGVLQTVPRPGDATATSGTLSATVRDDTVTVTWNGSTALTSTLTKSYPGTGCGVQVWQSRPHSVTVGGSCAEAPASAAGGQDPAAPAPEAPPGDWLSGASGPQAADGSYGAWRGDPVEIAGTWVNSPALYTLQPGGELGAWTKPVDVAIAPPDWQGWQAEADGVHDDFYHKLFAHLAQLRSGRGTTFVRPWYEFNGSWMPYHLTNADIPAFQRAWARVAAIARQEFPDVKLVYCAAASRGADVYAAFPGVEYVDVGGIDFYNNYPWVQTQAGFRNKADNGAGPYSLNDLQAFYQRKGLPFAINEWANQGAHRTIAQGGGGESPQFIDSLHAWMTAHARREGDTAAGTLRYEVQFNLWSDQFQLFPADQTVQPKTAARYVADF